MPIKLPPAGPIRIVGSPNQGSTLTITRQPGRPAYRWQRAPADQTAWADIIGGDGLHYTEQAADMGGWLRIEELVAATPRYSDPVALLGGTRHGILAWAALTIPAYAGSARRGQLTWAQMTIPYAGTSNSRSGILTWAKLTTPAP